MTIERRCEILNAQLAYDLRSGLPQEFFPDIPDEMDIMDLLGLFAQDEVAPDQIKEVTRLFNTLHRGGFISLKDLREYLAEHGSFEEAHRVGPCGHEFIKALLE